MFYTDGKLQFPVRVETPDPLFARALQQAIGGIEGEIRVAMQYFFQACGARGNPKFRDLLMNTAAEELGHIEMLATAVALNLEGAPVSVKDQVAADPVAAAVLGGLNMKNLLSAGLSATRHHSQSARLTAAVIPAAGQVRIEHASLRPPVEGEVRIKLEGCGVCASNLTPWAGPGWMQFPTEPGGLGHEGWGRIDAVGPGIDHLKIGDRVAALSYHAYASHDYAPAEMAVSLPDALDGKPFPGEPLGCAMNIFKRSEIRAGQTVAIIGIGFLGALLTQLAAKAGARVIAISRREQALEVARHMGAAETIAMDDHWRIIEDVRGLTKGRFCDCVIEAVGKQWPVDLAAELTMERGRLVIAGYHQDGPRQVNMQLWNWRGLDVINAHERDPAIYIQGIRDAVSAVSEGRLDPSSLYTHRYPLEKLGQALDATRDRPDNFIKALVVTP